MTAPTLSTAIASPWSEASASSHEAARAREEAEHHAAERRGAVLAIAGSARDTADARSLLDMLGLGLDDILAARPAARRPETASEQPAAKRAKKARKAHAA